MIRWRLKKVLEVDKCVKKLAEDYWNLKVDICQFSPFLVQWTLENFLRTVFFLNILKIKFIMLCLTLQKKEKIFLITKDTVSDINSPSFKFIATQRTRKFKKSRQKNLWNQINQKKFFCEIAFFGSFWNCKKWNLKFFELFDFTSFFLPGLDFF